MFNYLLSIQNCPVPNFEHNNRENIDEKISSDGFNSYISEADDVRSILLDSIGVAQSQRPACTPLAKIWEHPLTRFLSIYLGAASTATKGGQGARTLHS